MNRIIVRNIRTVIVCFMLVIALISNSEIVGAVARTGSEAKYVNGTYNVLTATTNLDFTAPLVGTCKMISNGRSYAAYNKQNTSLKRKLISHSLHVYVGGVGSVDIGSLDNSVITFDEATNTFSCDTFDWDYSIVSRKWRIVAYGEDHYVSYYLRNSSGKNIKTVTMAASLDY